MARVRVHRARHRQGRLRGARALGVAPHRRHLPHRELTPLRAADVLSPVPSPASNSVVPDGTGWSTVRMEMHTTPLTTPATAPASCGPAACLLRHHGQPVTLRTAGGGRRTAEHAAPAAG